MSLLSGWKRCDDNPILPNVPGTWMDAQTANPDLLDMGDEYFLYFRGQEGDWDEGAIWFTTVEKIEGRYYMWYEGYGGGTARTEPYGSYLEGGKSQIGWRSCTGMN